MATILTKRSNTASSVPVAGDLTNSTGGAELAVNTADKRLFTKDSGGTVVELGTNPSSVTLPNGTANGVAYLNGSKVLTSGSALTFDGSQLSVTRGSLGTSALFYTNDGTYNPRLAVYGTADGTVLQHTWSSGAASMIFALGGAVGSGSEQMRLTSTGLGIGTSSPGERLTVQTALTGTTAGSNTVGRFQSNGSGYDANIALGDNVNASARLGYLSGNMYFWTNGSERARIDSSGNLLVGTTSASCGGVTVTQHISASDFCFGLTATGGGASRQVARFSYSTTAVGSITVGASSTSYNTSSDYRLKENIAPMTGALAKVAALNPVTYTWKADGSDGQGFIAHELAEVCPAAVTGEKDAVDADGNPVYQGIDTSFLVATLTAAIQELKAEFDAYKASHP